MDEIGSEVSDKIRAAIKAKLIELGAYVDDELPDYIMVMVANKRTRSQMDEDLQLFLSSNTKVFTSWLHTVLQKLHEVTVANFESKKDSDSKKSSRRKSSESEDGSSKKSSEESVEKVKKHNKKHKESKKSKKNKHKSKDKGKGKKSGKDSSKSGKEENASLDKSWKSKKVELNKAVGRAILGDLRKSKKLKSSSRLSSSEEESRLDERSTKENESVAGSNKPGEDVPNLNDSVLGGETKSKVKEVIEDEFNIEPLKPSEKDNDVELVVEVNFKGSAKRKESESNTEIEKTVSAPTEELLKEHDKIQNEEFEKKEKTEGEKPKSTSEESLSPEEIRKQLLLSRAKKKLEESKKAERMRSNSPEVLILEETSGGLGGRQKDLTSPSSRRPEARSPRSDGKGSSRSGSPRRSRQRSSINSDRRSHSSGRSPFRKSKPIEGKGSNEERRKIVLTRSGRNSPPGERGEKSAGGKRKKNVISIAESLELEKNLGVKRESDSKSREKGTTRKCPLLSRVVTITGPEAPEIPSIVKVKPREFISKDKQANKTLILKAVADAEKSIATLQARYTEIHQEPKKEALYTKNLREKRYEKLAITLSNIRRNINSHDRLVRERFFGASQVNKYNNSQPFFRSDRRVSPPGSEKSEKKQDCSDGSDDVRMKSDLTSKKAFKSDDQFISSKTTITEKNDKYIRCWLEGVEKAVKEEEMINPSEMEEFVQYNFTDEENDLLDEEKNKKRKSKDPQAEISSKTLKLGEDTGKLRVPPSPGVKDDEPQIVVTLDGLDSKAIKDLILKNKETAGGPLLSTGGKNPEKSAGCEKMSDRFGRLNKGNEEECSRKTETGRKEKGKTENKNRELIAQLSEKFGKVDREFESRKRKRPDDDRRYNTDRRSGDKEDNERNGRYRKSERRPFREGGFGFYRRS